MKKPALRYNHIGYAPLAPKYFLAVETSFSSFEVLDELNEVVYSGELISRGVWPPTEENTLFGDFSALQKNGKYRIVVGDALKSEWFTIGGGWL